LFSTHARVLSTGEPTHITDANVSIHGSGAVGGDISTMSSTRGELHGQTAMAIISNTLLHAHNDSNIKITLHGDSQGVQQTCSYIHMTNLKYHRQPNTDLKFEYKKACEGLLLTNTWTRSHQDGDRKWESIEVLQNLNLSNMAIMNTWYDRKANEARTAYITHEDANVYPNEKWAL
jgi:hypothetical protein